jgi:hypothetical protein
MNEFSFNKESNIDDYCKSKDISKLKYPISFIIKEIKLPIIDYIKENSAVLKKNFSLLTLDKIWYKLANKKVNIKYSNINVIEYIINNSLNNSQNTPYVNLEQKISSINHSFDIKWFNEQNSYLLSLSLKEKYTLYGYTNKYGSKILNMYLNENSEKAIAEIYEMLTDINIKKCEIYFPFFHQILDLINHISPKYISTNQEKFIEFLNNLEELKKKDKIQQSNIYIYFIKNIKLFNKKEFWIHVLLETANTIDKIIKNSPPTTSPLLVYVSNNIETFDKIVNNNTLLYGFVSCSLDLQTTFHFMDFENKYLNEKCCLKLIKIPKDSRVLYLPTLSSHDNEAEILISKNSIFKVISINEKFNYNKELYNQNIDYENICDSSEKIIVSELEFINYEEL